jgi:DNA-binding FadR family transcriptional regulator
MPSFEPLVRRNVTMDAIALIKEMIVDGRLRPGQRLPSERALSEALGVSRPTIRESIRSLVSMHSLEVRQGAGTFVASLSLDQLLRPMQFAIALSECGWHDLFEVRLLIEPPAAALAAERASKDELDGMIQCARRGDSGRPRPDRVASLDYELHERIVNASKNGLLINVHKSISTLAKESRNITVRLPGVAPQAMRDHIEIVSAIASRDAATAEGAMQRHLSRIRDAALASLPSSELGNGALGVSLTATSVQDLHESRTQSSESTASMTAEH